MTDTMLERMARAMVAAQGDDYDALPEIGRRHAENECRAALEAIREPSEEVVRAALSRDDIDNFGDRAFTDIINAILSESPPNG